MSIEKQTCHRFQGPLGLNGTRHSVQRHIKVLQTLGCSAVQDAIDIKVLQTLGMARDRPSPYGSQRDVLCPTVARGPVPRAPYLSEAGSAKTFPLL